MGVYIEGITKELAEKLLEGSLGAYKIVEVDDPEKASILEWRRGYITGIEEGIAAAERILRAGSSDK